MDKDSKRTTSTTNKKQKFIRNRTLLDPETGELIPMQEVQVEDRDFNFHKVWLEHFLNSLDGISNQKMRLAFWIIENLNRENQLVMTFQAIAKKSGMSESTVARTMKALQDSEPPFLVKINSGAYQVNPDVIWKGTHKNRMGVCFTYNQRISEFDKKEETETEVE